MTHHYGEDSSSRDCTKCVLNGYAWKTAISSKTSACIHDAHSYFDLWERSRSRYEHQYWAMRMVKACNRAIEDLLIHGRLRP